MSRVLPAAILALLGGMATGAHAQGLTGQIGGSVIDSSNAIVPGATVVVRNTATAVTRETITDGQGLFVFTNLFAGTYDLRVSLTGFATHEQTGIILTSTERLSLPPVVLSVSGVETTVTVEASALRAATQSGERSSVIRSDEIQDTQLRGRDFLGLLQGMPGVVDTAARNAPGWNSFLGTQINGLSDQFMGMSYDGVGSKDTGFGAANWVAPSLDAIAEVKIQTSNYQAEYGRSGGANIIIVTKSGTSRFSGSGAYFKRHEAFNANSWDRRRTCDASSGASPLCEKERYRYDNSAFTLGGPVIIPGSDFNAERDKLFFFYSLDLLPRTDPFLVNSTFPSGAERNGDFSNTRNNAGQLRFIRDPSLAPLACNVNTGGPGCFPGNTIPQDRIHPFGRQALNIFPLPDPTLVGNPVTQGQYNYQYTGEQTKLRRDNVLRVDWNIRPGTTFYTRLQMGKEVYFKGYYGDASPNLLAGHAFGFQVAQSTYDVLTSGYVSTLIHTLSPSTVLEVIVGSNLARQWAPPLTRADEEAISYPVLLPAHRQYFDNNNQYKLVPNLTFSGGNALPGTRNIAFHNQFPYEAENDFHNFSVNVTHLRGTHNLKAGFFYERTTRPIGPLAHNAGVYDFSNNAANPLDTNLGWANALLGHLNSYSEGNNNFRFITHYNQPEAFIQDNWRVTRSFTLDLGARFSYIGVVHQPGRDIGWFDESAFNPAAAIQLWQPHCANGVFPCTGTNRVARNPITEEIRPGPWIGQVIEGSGDIFNGTIFGVDQPDSFPSPGISVGPRLGFGWDVTGDGRTSIRGGFGTSFNRFNDNVYGGFTGVLNRSVSLQWTTIDDRFNAPTLQAPLAGTAVQPEMRAVAVHSWSLGVQRELPWKLLGDVAYVGNRTKNGFSVTSGSSYTLPLNDIRPQDRVNPRPEWIDPTTANLYPDNFIRPNYPGRGAISLRLFRDDMFRDYHAIQFEIRRRLSNGLAWAANYTGSITKGWTTFDWYRTVADNENRYTSRQGGRPHNVKFSYNWMVPGASKFLGGNPIAAGVLDGWQFSGITTLLGGTWDTFGFNWTGLTGTAEQLTGGLGGSRVIITCDPNLPRSERTFDRQYRTECVRPPGPLTDPSDTLYQGTGEGVGTLDARMGLGYINHDFTLLKNFSLGNRRNLQVRFELYNAFNTTQYQGVNTTATFDFATGQQTNTAFGAINGVRANSNRVGQLGVRFTF